MTQQIKDIVVVGGGTAGWLAAAILAKKLQVADHPRFTVTLVESPDIPRIGVGEGTVPTMRDTLRLIGVSEADFIRECDATFKQSILFVDWMKQAAQQQPHRYYHLFNFPHTPQLDLAPFWYQQRTTSFAESLTIQAALCDANKAPKKISTAEFQGVADYAYHLDATKFAQFLTKHCVEKLGVVHIKAHVEQVQLRADGAIAALQTREQGVIAGDFFVDCSGFDALLLGQALHVPFVSKSDVLFVDKALALQLPYDREDAPIASYTIATAQSAGWIWDIGLTSRRGTGLAYASQFISDDQAETEFRRYLGPAADPLSVRKIPMRVGYRQQFFSKNCMAVGLAAGFVEPLEATAIMLVEASCKMLAELFPAEQAALPLVADKINAAVRYSWDRVIDFIKLHYLLSNRQDNSFWQANRECSSVPESLQQKLALWQYQFPSRHDFSSRYEVFSLENFQYILYGMQFEHQQLQWHAGAGQCKFAQDEFYKLQQYQEKMLPTMPGHRELIEKIKRYGLPKI